MRVDLMERAHGRWKDILAGVGIEQKFLQNRHGPCPICGGRDRFRFDNKQGNGTFYCSGDCGAGNGVKLVMLKRGCEFKDAAREIEKQIGSARKVEDGPVMSDAQKLARIKARWTGAMPVEPDSPTFKYLLSRKIVAMLSTNPPKVLRDDTHRPAMIAIVQGPSGRGTMAHLTLLTEDGQKAPTEKQKLFMPGFIAKGSAVRLFEPGATLGIAEGIETALSATQITGIPCWAALNDTLLTQWEPPEGVERVVVFGDNDRNYVGQAAAYALAKRLSIKKNPIAAEVRLPERAGDDWNDVLRKM